MGGFYANVAIKTNDTAEIIKLVEGLGLPATVVNADGIVVVVDSRLDEQDEGWLTELTCKLSAASRSPALGVLNHDDSLLLISLAQNGKTLANYNSCPDYFTGEGGNQPVGGDVDTFAVALNPQVDKAQLDRTLNTGIPDDPEADFPYAFESVRHGELTNLLNLPSWTVWFSQPALADFSASEFGSSRIVYRKFAEPRRKGPTGWKPDRPLTLKEHIRHWVIRWRKWLGRRLR